MSMHVIKCSYFRMKNLIQQNMSIEHWIQANTMSNKGPNMFDGGCAIRSDKTLMQQWMESVWSPNVALWCDKVPLNLEITIIQQVSVNSVHKGYHCFTKVIWGEDCVFVCSYMSLFENTLLSRIFHCFCGQYWRVGAGQTFVLKNIRYVHQQ